LAQRKFLHGDPVAAETKVSDACIAAIILFGFKMRRFCTRAILLSFDLVHLCCDFTADVVVHRSIAAES